ncbi:MAG: cell division protein FtsZ, partial [Halobacteriaceae archaeon]
DAAEGRFADYNEYVASAIVDLVSGPVLERIDPSEYDEIDPPVIDLQDVVTSITFDDQPSGSRPGYASLGRSITMTKSLSGYLLPFVGHKQIDTASLSRVDTRTR